MHWVRVLPADALRKAGNLQKAHQPSLESMLSAQAGSGKCICSPDKVRLLSSPAALMTAASCVCQACDMMSLIAAYHVSPAIEQPSISLGLGDTTPAEEMAPPRTRIVLPAAYLPACSFSV